MSSDGDDHHDDRHKAALNAKQRGIDHYVVARYSEAERAFTEAIAISTRGIRRSICTTATGARRG